MKRKGFTAVVSIIAAATFVFSLYMIVTTLITGAQEQSAFDELITLSTCSYHTDNGRFVVVARKR